MQPKESSTSSHFFLSLLKSVIRLWAFLLLFYQEFTICAVLLAIAEGIGIIEEF